MRLLRQNWRIPAGPWPLFFTLVTATAAFRFLASEGFSDDDYVHLAGAQQMLFGDLPSRDFLDPGHPLMFVVSAIGQALLGHSFLSEVLVVGLMFGLTAAATAWSVERLTGSRALGSCAALIGVASFPSLHNYPKVLVSAVGLCFVARYISAPTGSNLLRLAASVAIAFLFRHDLGAYIGVGALTAVLLVPVPSMWDRARVTFRLGLLVLLLLLPYFVYLASFGGLSDHFLAGFGYAQRYAAREWLNPFAPDAGPEAWLLYVVWAVPLSAAVLSAFDWVRRGHPNALVVSVMVVALAENAGLVRDLPRERIPDALVPIIILGCWLVHRARETKRPIVLAPAAATLVVVAGLVWSLGGMDEQLSRAGLTGRPWSQLPDVFVERSSELQERFSPAQFPSRAVEALLPFMKYLDRCVAPRDRIFLVNLSEVAYFARRPFGGGAPVLDYYQSRSNQERVVAWLSMESAPFAVLRSDYEGEFRSRPLVSDYVRRRYASFADVAVDDWRAEILVERQLQMSPGAAIDGDTGWPCYRPSRLSTLGANVGSADR